MNSFPRYITFLSILLVLMSCRINTKKELMIDLISFADSSNAILPHLVSDQDQLYLSWVDSSSHAHTELKYAKLEDGHWGKPVVLSSGTNWFMNWADYPMISVNNGFLLSHYLQNSGTKGMAYDIYYRVSKLGQANQEKFKPLHNDNTATEHGFVSMLPMSDSTFLIAWLDGRNMASHNHGSMHSHEHAAGEMSVRIAEVNLQGELKNETVVDEMACTCCQTTMSMTESGPVLMYRDCSEDNIRDISIVRLINGNWTKPVSIHQDNWFIQGCPVNGPKSDALGSSLAVAWYTAANDKPKVQVVFSKNSGESFQKPFLVSDGEVVGRVDLSMISGDEAVVSWMETINKETFLFAAKVTEKEGLSNRVEIAKMSSSRKTGFPQMERLGDDLYFAWMDINDKGSKLKTAVVPIQKF